MRKQTTSSESFCMNVYYLAEVNRRACEMLRKVLENYVADSTGSVTPQRIDQQGLYRTVCDYIAQSPIDI